MGFSNEDSSKKEVKRGAPQLVGSMPRLPEQIQHTRNPALNLVSPSDKTAEQLEHEEVSELSEVYQHINMLYSRMSQINNILSEFSISHSDNHPQILKSAVTKAEDARNLLHSVISESGATKEKAILLKRKLMQHHELHSDQELLRIQNDAFSAISQIRSHLSRIEEVIDLVVLTANEFIQANASNSSIDLDVRDEIKQVQQQMNDSEKLISHIMQQLLTIKQMEEELEEVNLHEQVHKELHLEVEDLQKIAKIFNNVYNIFANTIRKNNINALTATNAHHNTFGLYRDLLHNKILPVLQQCMKYEEGLFKAAAAINYEIHELLQNEDHVEQETLHSNAVQTEIRLFTSNLRTTFRELNSNIPEMLEHIDEEINVLVDNKNVGYNKIQRLAKQSRFKQIEHNINDGKIVIKKALEMLNFMRRNAHSMYYYMANAEKTDALPALPDPAPEDKPQL